MAAGWRKSLIFPAFSLTARHARKQSSGFKRFPGEPMSHSPALWRRPVTTAVQQLLNAFDALPEADKHQVAVEIFRRVSPATEGDVPESALVEAAEDLFCALDAEEARHAQR